MARGYAGAERGPIEAVGTWVLIAGLIGFVAALAYLLYGAFLSTDAFYGYSRAQGGALPMDEYLPTLERVELALRLLTLGGIGILLGALGRFWAYYETAFALGALGAGLVFGVPLLFEVAGSGIPADARARALQPIAQDSRVLGLLLLAVAAIHFLAHSVLVYRRMREERAAPRTDVSRGAFSKQPPAARRNRFLGPCWELPHCRDTVHKICPIRHSRRPCWRRGRGCYCDQDVVLALSGGQAAGQTRQSLAFTKGSARHAPDRRTKREQCLGCPIYLHHQSQKHRLLAPAFVIGFFALLANQREALFGFYPEAMRSLGRAVSGFAFSPEVRGTVPTWAEEMAASPGMEWLLLIVGAALVVSYLLHMLEWTLYRWGI